MDVRPGIGALAMPESKELKLKKVLLIALFATLDTIVGGILFPFIINEKSPILIRITLATLLFLIIFMQALFENNFISKWAKEIKDKRDRRRAVKEYQELIKN